MGSPIPAPVQLSTSHGSGTTFSRLLSRKLGWIFLFFFQSFMHGELFAANLKFSAFPYNN